MTKSTNNKLRTLYVMETLLERSDEEHRVSTKQLIEMLERNGIYAERKTIYDDIESLKTWGMDILYTKEKPSGFYVGSRKFELPELKLLVDAVQASKFITAKKSIELIKKLESMTSTEEAKQLQRQVFIANRTKTVNESIYYNVDKIHDAILGDNKIRFTYYKWDLNKELVPRNDGKPFEVSPWALTWDDENYYMIAFDALSKTVKHYRVDKMQKIEILKETRDGEEVFKNFDMAIFAKNTFGMYGGKIDKVTMEFDNRLIGVVMDRFGTDVIIQKVDESHFRVRCDVRVSGQFYGWIAGLGPDVKIVHPESVVDGFREFVRGILDRY
ncbi:MAG: WYL domain-containing protein [Bacillota bacterium]|nr:WYL domain-containing protein [Bacillota bacterium]